jgi:hypothetical protein
MPSDVGTIVICWGQVRNHNTITRYHLALSDVRLGSSSRLQSSCACLADCIVNTFECESSWVGLCTSSFCGELASTLDGRFVGFSTRRDTPSNRELSSIDKD